MDRLVRTVGIGVEATKRDKWVGGGCDLISTFFYLHKQINLLNEQILRNCVSSPKIPGNWMDFEWLILRNFDFGNRQYTRLLQR